MDTRFVADTLKKYHTEFSQLRDTHLSHGDEAYRSLYFQMLNDIQGVYGEDAGNAIAESGKPAIGMFMEMTMLAHPKIVQAE